uniref:Putative ixostatin n=1 Tax=Ixodes ricinus TaxID=34613 RepID=A0A0K8R6P9_IXORI
MPDGTPCGECKTLNSTGRTPFFYALRQTAAFGGTRLWCFDTCGQFPSLRRPSARNPVSFALRYLYPWTLAFDPGVLSQWPPSPSKVD